MEERRGGTHLLPAFDEYIIGYQNRRAALTDEHSNRVIPGKNGMFLPTLVHDGAVVGTWKRTMAARQVAVTPASFELLSKTAASAALRAAKNYARFQGLPLGRDA